MQRLALAVLIVGLLLVVGAGLVRALGATSAGEAARDSLANPRSDPMQKVAFFLLLALIVYVSVLGGG